MTKKRIPRDPEYGKPPRWGRLYAKYFPMHTDPFSRHVGMISERLRDTSSDLRRVLYDAGYEPDHMARSMEITVEMLWKTRHASERRR